MICSMRHREVKKDNSGKSGRNNSDMAVTRWRPLEEYHPAVRLMVRYMWRQEPPLLPSGFADQLGLPRQLVSRWLQIQPPTNESKATDTSLPSLSPPLAVKIARAMGMAPHEFLLAVGMSTAEEPLFSVEDAWEYVLARFTSATTPNDSSEAGDSQDEPGERSISADEVERLRSALDAARAVDLAQRASETSATEPEQDSQDAQDRPAEA